MPRFYCTSWESRSGLHACLIDTPPPDLSSQPTGSNFCSELNRSGGGAANMSPGGCSSDHFKWVTLKEQPDYSYCSFVHMSCPGGSKIGGPCLCPSPSESALLIFVPFLSWPCVIPHLCYTSLRYRLSIFPDSPLDLRFCEALLFMGRYAYLLAEGGLVFRDRASLCSLDCPGLTL